MKYWHRAIKIYLLFAFFGSILLQILFADACYAQNFVFEGKRKKDALTFDQIKNLIVVPLYLNGKGPYNFILDTGVGSLIITDPVLLDTLQIKNPRTIKVYGFGQGEEIDAFLTNDVSVKISEASAAHVPTAILKKDIFDLSSYLGQKIYGLIGYPFFNSFVVKVNYGASRLSFSLPSAKVKKRGHQVPIFIENNRPYLFADIEDAHQKRLRVKLIIDCGASHPLSMYALAGKPFPIPKDTISANLGVGLSGVINGSMGRLSSLTLGKYSFKNILSGFPAYEALAKQMGYDKNDGNLGAEVLKRFTVVFDYPNLSMYLKPNSNYKTPFEHDMSGIEVYMDPNNKKHVFIGRIEPGSPAEKAGFLEQDEIVSLNMRFIQEYSLEDISKLFKSDDGRTILVEIVRNNRNLIKLLRLKRRI